MITIMILMFIMCIYIYIYIHIYICVRRTFLAWATALAALSPGAGGVPEADDSSNDNHHRNYPSDSIHVII